MDADAAEKHCIAGGGVWPQYSTDGGKDPDIVLVGIGVETTEEVRTPTGPFDAKS